MHNFVLTAGHECRLHNNRRHIRLHNNRRLIRPHNNRLHIRPHSNRLHIRPHSNSPHIKAPIRLHSNPLIRRATNNTLLLGKTGRYGTR